MDSRVPKKQTTAGKKARAAARAGEKYTTALRGQLPSGTGPAAMSPATDPARRPGLEHRALMDEGPGWRPFRGTGLFRRIGGQQAVDRLVDRLYEGISGDAQLRPLFPRDLAGSRSRQKLFFAEWLGGPGRYSEQAHAGLRHTHDGLPITAALADRWLGHLRRALEATVTAGDDRAAIATVARSLATALVSGQVAPAQPTGRRRRPGSSPGNTSPGNTSPGDSATGNSAPQPVAWCGIAARNVARARDLAHRGDLAGLGAALAQAPDLLLPSYAAAIMQAAALAGRFEIVAMLLERGVGADHPFFLPVNVTGMAFERVVFVTPLCAARMKRRRAAESLLMAAGAREDVFTAAFLGDRDSLARMLAADPGLAQAADPAVDVLAITPVDHAVAGGQPDALRLLLGHAVLDHALPEHAGDPPAGYARALRGAAARGSAEMAELLLAHGADATRIGVGRWVLDPVLAPLLASHGAAIDSSGAWIGASCTGNQGRTDDPDYVRALLRHGARVTDRRGTSSGEQGNPDSAPGSAPGSARGSAPDRPRDNAAGVRALDATALHYAARAGFLRTIEVLLEHGADPGARDSRGRTPLDWLEEAAPSVSRAAVTELLAPRP
jgi:truncated hemoglobin YjbI